MLGQGIAVTIDANGVFINGAQVTVADIRTFNGVVHVIDAVILPPASTVVDVIVNSPVHTTLETAVVEAGLAGTLSGDGPFTIFAPTDDAFANLPAGTLDALLMDPTGDLAKILQYHVLSGEVLSSDLTDGQIATTLLGQEITVTIDASGVMINNALVTAADIRTFNGVVHVIDAVLLPDLTSVRDLDQVNLKVAPNPTTDFITIDLPQEMLNDKVNAQMIGLDGNILKDWNITATKETINVTSLSAGVYILLLKTEKTFARSTVVIK